MAFEDGDETLLIDRARSGDPDAFSELFHRYYSMIYAFAYRLCFDKADAQDVAQETFVKAARSLHSYQRKAPFKQWLYGIAANASHDTNRSLARKTRTVEALTGVTLEADTPADYSDVHRALESLGEDLRITVTLVFLEGMNHAEAARALGCAETTISWRIFVAKRKLKHLLEIAR